MDKIARIFHTMSRSMETNAAEIKEDPIETSDVKKARSNVAKWNKKADDLHTKINDYAKGKAAHLKDHSDPNVYNDAVGHHIQTHPDNDLLTKTTRHAAQHRVALKRLERKTTTSSISYKHIKPDPIEKTDLAKAIKSEDKWTGRALALHSQIKSVGKSHKLYPEYMETVRHSGEHEIALDKLEKRKKI